MVRDLFDECMKHEAEARRHEYSETDHQRKAFWHAQRWLWLNKAQAIAEGRNPREVK